jgi:capsular polysaccharide biosynthesis protein
MDIQDYVYAIRRRLWLPIALPLVAALLTAGFIYIQPERYQATATVVVPALSAKGYSTSAVTQYVSTFKDVLVSAQVVDPINLRLGERKSDLVAGLSASTATASSNIIQVTYTGPNKKTVQPVAYNAAVFAMDALLAPQVSAAKTGVANSLTALQVADQNLSDFSKQTGLLFPVDDYRLKSQQLAAFGAQLTQAQLAGDKHRVSGLTLVVANFQAQLVNLAGQVVQWQKLDEARHSAQAENDKATIELNTALAALASDQAPSAVAVRFVGHVSRVPEILRYAGVAFGVALLLSLGYIVFMEFMNPAVATAAAGGFRGALRPARRPSLRVPAGVTKVVTKVAPGGTEADPGVTKIETGAAEPPLSETPTPSNGEL